MSLQPPRNRFAWARSKPTIHPELKAAADSCRLLGLLFVVLGALPLVMAQFGVGLSRGPMWLRQAMAVMTTLVLVGPGAWYFVAARLTRRADRRAIRISLVVVSIQIALIVFGFTLLFMGRLGEALVIPSFVGLFFLPALAAAAWHLVRARRTAATIDQSHGFDLLAPKPVMPMEPAVPVFPEPKEPEGLVPPTPGATQTSPLHNQNPSLRGK